MGSQRSSRGNLFRKYLVLIMALVGGALLASSALHLYRSYQESQASLLRFQREKALTAASKIEEFITEIQRQIRLTGQSPWVAGAGDLKEQSFEYRKLFRQAPAVTEVGYIDATGKERLRVSRLAMDVTERQADHSRDPSFREAKAGRTFFSSVYFRKESEPYMTIAMSAGGADAGVMVAEVNLKFIWDAISQIRVGRAGYAYVVDSHGELIAHPDISLVLKKTHLSSLAQVQGARASGSQRDEGGTVMVARDLQGARVLTASAGIAPLGWWVFVEQPLKEAFEPLYGSLLQSALLVAVCLALSAVGCLFLARRMVTPIQALQAGAARIGAGDLTHRIQVRTDDELEALADEFNQTAARLQESYEGLERKVDERTRELSESLEQQTATSEVLKAISRSTFDLQPVLNTLIENATRICGAARGVLLRVHGETYRVAAAYGTTAEYKALVERTLFPSDRGTATGRAILERRAVQIPDVIADPGFTFTEGQRLEGYRTLLAVPLFKEGVPIGAIAIWRLEVRPFTDKQIELLQTFADQAVIAIENVRLFQELQARNRDLSEALERQTATSEILRVISSSPTDIQPVLNAVAESAARLCEAADAAVLRVEGESLRVAAHCGQVPLSSDSLPVNRGSVTGRAVVDRQVIHVHDLWAESAAEFPNGKAIGPLSRTVLAAPLLREDVPIGAIIIRRMEVRPFSQKHIDLLRTFADQAVIAIENVRLFQELQARNRDLSEALERQTTTSEVLKVISRSTFDLQPVLDTLLENAARLCGAQRGQINRLDGDVYRLAAAYNIPPEFKSYLAQHPMRPGRGTVTGRAALERRTVQIPDVLADAEYEYGEGQRLGGYRTLVAVPMLREGIPIGLIVLWKEQVQAFTPRQIELVETFADQAVIAIENVRLFQELQARTGELARSVEELKGLGEVGQAVSSTLDLQTVLTTIVARAVQLSGTSSGVIYEYDEAAGEFRLTATHGWDEEMIEARQAAPIRLGEGAIGQAAATRAPVQVPDILDERAPMLPMAREMLAQRGCRSLLAIPLLREQRIVGGLTVLRREAGNFAPEVVNLLQTFATQSVLAIQNARLFREIEEKGRQIEVASRHKSQFLANMSHELRTPLNAVLGYTKLILNNIYGQVPEKIRDVLVRVEQSGRHLLGLINDVLDLSKMEAGQLTLSLEDYSMKHVVQTAFSAMEPLAAEKKLALKVTMPPDLPLAKGDPRRVTQVLLNLVGNAIKFTEAGEVRVEVTASGAKFTAAVADTGPGISPADQGRIFEEFQQVDSSSTRKKGGTGLGLSIARGFVEAHRGTIRAVNREGGGLLFVIRIPMERTAVPQSA